MQAKNCVVGNERVTSCVSVVVFSLRAIMRQCSRGMKLLRVGSLLAVLSLHDAVAAFGPISVTTKGNNGPSSFATTTRQLQQQQLACFYNDFEGYNDHDDDDADAIDVNALGDWRAFRRNLAFQSKKERAVVSVSSLNEELLASQSKELAQEYKTGVWAHTIATVRDDKIKGGVQCSSC
jgi:hypothetical protein